MSSAIPDFEDAPSETTALIDGNAEQAKNLKLCQNLQEGLRGWIRVNKSRKERISQSVEKCQDIQENSSNFSALMEESARIQTHMKESINKTNEALKNQHQELTSLAKAADDFGKKLRSAAEMSRWAVPTQLLWATLACMLIMGLLMSVPYICNAYGVYTVNLPSIPTPWKKSSSSS